MKINQKIFFTIKKGKNYLKSAANMVFTAPKLERSSSKSWLSDSTA